MQSRLIQRYLGNKALIADTIVATVKDLARPGDLIFDAFSGTLSVTASLRDAGFRVASNDISHFSWTYARAYFSEAELPWPEKSIVNCDIEKNLAWQSAIDELTAPYSNCFPKLARRRDIFDHYCEAGTKSDFVSARGRTGRRRFFSSSNAELIDRALSRIRYWYRESIISEHSRCILMATLLSAVEKVSNTQGTFHDFPREYFDPRALQAIVLRAPDASLFSAPSCKYIGKARDTLEFVDELPEHRAIYIDPPYNFRQYTSYYFMLNLLSQYPDIEDLDGYFSQIEFVRGQNMQSDFKSSFSSKKTFISSLGKLISKAKAQYVILSYFDGRNHWGSFKRDGPDSTGRQKIDELFHGSLFVPGSVKCIPVPRRNYQSYGGFPAREVNEFLFVGEKRMLSSSAIEEGETCGVGGGRSREATRVA